MIGFRRLIPLLGLTLLAAACSLPQAPGGRAGSGREQPGRTKTLVIGISNAVDVMPPSGSNTTSGGWQSINELWAQGLVTSDRDARRPVPRLATQVPSFEAGTLSILPDGRMRTVYPLRTDVTWHDGVRFTAQDLPVTLLYFNPTTASVRKGVLALDDYKGAAEGAQGYGTFSRNAHEWDII